MISQKLRRISTKQPDLVLLDLMIPRPDGHQVCRRIRSVSAVPVIMLTARGDERDRVRGLDRRRRLYCGLLALKS